MHTFTELAALVAARPHYVRWSSDIAGDLVRGRSRNHQTGQLEAGLSVNPLQSEVLGGAAYIAQQLVEYRYLSAGTGARPYLLTGDVVGRGSDNEPVIVGAELVGEISAAVLAEADRIAADAQRGRIFDAAARYPWLSGRDLAREVARVVGCWPEDAAAVLETR